MRAFDAHCHLAHAAFDADRDDVIARARAAGVARMHVPGYDLATWTRAQSLLAEPSLACGAGLHPWWVAEANVSEVVTAIAELRRMVARQAPRSIGECGLDRAGGRAPTTATQLIAFIAQVGLSRDSGLPLVLHVVQAHGHALPLLEAEPLPGGVVHGFTGAPEVALRYVALGLHVSFGTAIMRPRAERAHAAARAVPLSRLLVESDAPDQPLVRGTRNEPSAVLDVLRRLAELRGAPVEAVAEATFENASRLFGFP